MLLLPALFLCLQLNGQGYYSWPQHVGLNSWAISLPVEQSTELTGIGFTGRHASYTRADTWYPSWASDGMLYSPWTDGWIGDERCTSYPGQDAHTGQAKIIGDDPLDLEVVSLGTTRGTAIPYQGRYPCGSLIYNGIWYHGSYCLLDDPSLGMNWPILGPFVGFRISDDYGKTWDHAGVSPAENLFGEHTDLGAKPVKIGAPHFVDFGQNMEHSPDGYAYLVGHGALESDPKPRPGNLSWISGDQVCMIRVKPSPETINDPSAYEFFAGRDVEGNDIWSGDMDDLQPIFEWNNKCGCVTVTYIAPLKKYLMCITDGWPTLQSMDSYILESDYITGPWKMLSYLKDFGPQAYFVNIPSKFISEDGLTAWLCYSANFSYTQNDPRYKGNPEGSSYSMTLQEIKLLND